VWCSYTGTFHVDVGWCIWCTTGRPNQGSRAVSCLVRVDITSSASMPRLGPQQSISAHSFRRCGGCGSCHGVCHPYISSWSGVHGGKKFLKNKKKHSRDSKIGSGRRASLPNTCESITMMRDGLLRNDGSVPPTVDDKGSVSPPLPRWPRFISTGLVLIAVLAVIGRLPVAQHMANV
jgi:hypothetical protein